MTKYGKKILEIVSTSRSHMTAEEIFDALRQTYPTVVLATVYNNLNAMNEAGIINRVHMDGGADCFERTTDKHDHMICDVCGKLTNVRFPELQAHLQSALGREIDSYDLTIHCVCPDCRGRR